MSLFPRFTQELSPLFRLLDDYERHAVRPQTPMRSFSPKFDVKELKDAYELHGEFPGVEQKDINIEWTDANTLTISGRHEAVREEGWHPTASIENGGKGESKKIEGKKEHQPTVEDENANTETSMAKTSGQQDVAKHNENEAKYWVSERSVGSFQRSFSFPVRVDQDGIKASLKNGVLSVFVPKAKKAEPKKVVIE